MTSHTTNGALPYLLGSLLSIVATAIEANTLLRPLGIAEPMPMHLEPSLEGRDFQYNDVSFLNRISFLPIAPLASGLAEDREGLHGTAGSTRSNELYSLINMQATMPLDNDWFVRYRFQRGEDFDGRFDRNLLGLGRKLNQQWDLVFSGDVLGDKSRIDIEMELSHRDGTGNHARFVVVAPDYPFNDKQDEARFTRQHYTAFTDLRWQVSPATALLAFVNHNAPMHLHNVSENLDFRYRQDMAGLALQTYLGRAAWLHVWLEGERARRTYQSLIGENPASSHTRRFHEAGAELRVKLGEGWTSRTGMRFLYFDESGFHPTSPDETILIRREELMLHIGVSWRMSARHTLHPVAYLNFIDNQEREQAEDMAHLYASQRFVGKVGLPLEWRISEATGASAVINPTFYLHRAAFGGGNVQMRIPF